MVVILVVQKRPHCKAQRKRMPQSTHQVTAARVTSAIQWIPTLCPNFILFILKKV